MSAAYWEEAVAIAFEEAGAWSAYAGLTKDQCQKIGESLEGSHENYGMAHYTPPPSDRINQIEREWEAKFKTLQREFDDYRGDAEAAVRKALRQRVDTQVSIGKHGEVLRHGGRTEVIQ